MKRRHLPRPRDRPLCLILLAALAVVSCELNGADDSMSVEPSGGGSAGNANGSTAGGSDAGRGEISSSGQGGYVVEPVAQAGQAGGGQAGQSAGGACSGSDTDGACSSCMGGHCCPEWQACEQDPDCLACAACLDTQVDLGACVVMGLCDIAPRATADALRCGLDACVSECGFD